MSNLPAQQSGIWTRFSADPRVSGQTRASDADRDVAAQALSNAFSEGRLDVSEHSDRLGRALAAKQLGEFVPLLSDLPDVAPSVPSVHVSRHPKLRNPAIIGWLGLAVLFNLIWLFTWLPDGSPYYYWPMWPMLGTAIPAVMAWMGMKGRDVGSDQVPPPAEPGPNPDDRRR